MAAAAWGAGVQAASNLHMQLRQESQQSGQSRQARSFALHQGDIAWNRAREWEEKYTDTQLQRRVADAKAAGLHPLFAIGAGTGGGGGYSAQIATPQYTGSYAGDGIARAGQAVGKYLKGIEPRKQQAELFELNKQKMQAEIDHMELLNAAAKLKLTEQQTLYWGDGNPGITGNGQSDVKVYPYSAGPRGLPLNQRPRTDTGQKSQPLRAELIADDGWRYRVLSPDAGMDEIGQADLVYQWMMRKTRRARMALPREIKLWMSKWKTRKAMMRRTPARKYKRKW